jgi:hypothetical protein
MKLTLKTMLIVMALSSTGARAVGNDQHDINPNVRVSEALIDTFYSFKKDQLEAALMSAKSSIPSVVFYQGWAEGGNYKIVNRLPCIAKKQNLVSCSITVQDDLMLALKIDFHVTDTFDISFEEGRIFSVETSSNDLDVFWTAREWVNQKHPELIKKPCQGIWDGGPTPAACVRAMVEGYTRFAASKDFPEI